MCGIVGILGQEQVAPLLLDSLKRLEYRGYDSAGIATLDEGNLSRRRAKGKLRNLEQKLIETPLKGHSGIGHTRWATHGAPTETNAHPHISDNVTVVHNGIIENFKILRSELETAGYQFETETDTEVIAHQIAKFMAIESDPVNAVSQTLKKLEGAFALAILFGGHEDLMIVARQGSPLAIGYGDNEIYAGSDAIALAPFTSSITYLEDGDWAVLRRQSCEIFNSDGKVVERPKLQSMANAFLVDKGNHRHFMAKEIHEQPEVIGQTLSHYVDIADGTIDIPQLNLDFSSLSRLSISACGTAYYAGLVAKYWFERFARLPVEIDIASEFRYRQVPMSDNGAALFISQSGETADTLACLNYCKDQGQKILSIVNVRESTIARASDTTLPTLAGPEIGVASTKAFTCQMMVLACLAIAAGKARGTISSAQEKELVQSLIEVPGHIAAMLAKENEIANFCHHLTSARDVLYLGRGTSYPIALEGALKLKEISYIHAEGYAAGELKHGPIALIDENMPVIVVAPQDELFDKTRSNMEEVQARGGRIILISDVGKEQLGCQTEKIITIPETNCFTSPFITAIPVQLLAYYTAVHMGTDVDQPRNLAKSVTVE